MAQKIEKFSQLSFRQFMDMVLESVKGFHGIRPVSLAEIKNDLKYKVVYPDKELAEALERLVSQGELRTKDFKLDGLTFDCCFEVQTREELLKSCLSSE